MRRPGESEGGGGGEGEGDRDEKSFLKPPREFIPAVKNVELCQVDVITKPLYVVKWLFQEGLAIKYCHALTHFRPHNNKRELSNEVLYKTFLRANHCKQK